jgi:excisionase family DNA binding protein
MKFMTMNEVADILAVNRITVHRLIKSGQLKAIKVNSAVRIPENSFQEYIRRSLGINEKVSENIIEDNYCDDTEKLSTAQSLLKLAGAWAGNDADEVLSHIIKTRSKAEF